MKNLAFVVLIFLFSVGFSQQFNFVNFSLADGLPQSQITSLCQDRSGFLWIGTETGLSRFDGITFVNYTSEDGLPDNEIDCIFLDEENVIWIGTPKGLAKYNTSKFEAFPFSQDYSIEYNVNDIALLKGVMCLATDQGIVTFNKNMYNVISYDDEVVSFRSLVKMNGQKLFCASKGGLFEFDGREIIKSPISIFNEINLSDLSITQNNLYASTYGNGVLRYNLSSGEVTTYELPIMRVRAMHVSANTILCATKNGAIEINELTNEVLLYNGLNGLAFENIRTVLIDREENIWIGTDGKGLFKLTCKSVVTYTKADGIFSNAIMGITQNASGAFVFSTYESGVTFWSKDTLFIPRNYNEELKNSTVWTSWLKNDGLCLVASSGGIDVIDNQGIVLRNYFPSEINSKIRSIQILSDSIMFFGGSSGLLSYSNGNVDSLFAEKNLDVNKMVVNESEIFLATTTGLFVFNFKDQNYSLQLIELPENNVKSLDIDQYGNLWIGTNSKGMYVRTKSEQLFPFNLDLQDAGSRTVLSVLVTSKNEIWVSTLNGVYQVVISDLNNTEFLINHFGYAEGMITLECNQNALFEDNDGHIWVGTSDGLVEINPAGNDKLFKQRKPELLISGIRLFMEDFDYKLFSNNYDKITGVPFEIVLPYNKNHLTFDFIGINLKDPQGVRYQYRLLGAEEEWSPLTSNRYATYSFINHGEYDFEVRAVNASGDYSEIKRIHVLIEAPFWLTWWFILLSIVVGSSLLFMIFQIRVRAIKQKEENEKLGYKNRLLFLEQQSLNASMNRHFIFNSLNSIQYFINSSNKLAANKYLTSFAKLIRKNLDSSQANNFIVSMREELERIELYLSLEKMRFEGKFEYTLDIDEEIDQDGIEMPSMILQPFVENSIIHGVLPIDKKGHILIKAYREFDYLIFEVEDDGIGIDESLAKKNKKSDDHHESMGMEITNRRIELLRKLTGENLMLIGPFQTSDSSGKITGTKVIIKIFIENQLD